MTDKYISTGGGNIRPAALMEWAPWFEHSALLPFVQGGRLVALDEIGGGSVSTQFLGLDLRTPGTHGESLPFETLVTGGPHSGHRERYATLAEAEAGHARALALVNAAPETITVPAHGAPLSFARSVQHDPAPAVELLNASAGYLEALDSLFDINATDDVQYGAWSARLGAAVERLRVAVRACALPTLVAGRAAVVTPDPTPAEEPL